MEAKTTFIEVEGCRFWIPAWLDNYWPYSIALKDFPSFCGAGNGGGVGDRAVPETIWFLRVAALCFIHDVDWAMVPNTKGEFHAANSRFRYNLLELIRKKSCLPMRVLRERRALTYYQFVETAGTACFKSDPVDLETYDHPLDHPTVVSRFERLGVRICGR